MSIKPEKSSTEDKNARSHLLKTRPAQEQGLTARIRWSRGWGHSARRIVGSYSLTRFHL